MTDALSASFFALLALELELAVAADLCSAVALAFSAESFATATFTQLATELCCSVVSIHLKVWKTWGGAVAACI